MKPIHRAFLLALSALAFTSCDAVEDVVDVVDPQPDLEIAIGASTLEVADGFEVVYTIVASNRGPAEATEVSVSAPVPDQIDGSINTPPGADCGAFGCSEGEIITWSVGTLAAGQSRAYSVAIPLDQGPSGYTYAFSTSVDSPTANSASTTVTNRVDDSRAMSVGLFTGSGSARPGETVTFGVAYVTGSSPALGVTVRIPVPDGLTFASATEGGQVVGNDVVWAVGSVPANAAGRLEASFGVRDDREPGHSITATARLTAGSVSASSQVVVVVAPPSRLRVSLQANPESVRDGFGVTYSAQVSNPGSEPAESVVVSLPVTNRIDGSINTPPGADCGAFGCSEGEIITWSFGTIAAGQSRAVSVTIPVESGPSGYLAPASVSADSPTVAAGVATWATPVLD